jgi:hypothetical protein
MSNNGSKVDDRFYTPRAQASTARSTGSYGTPRSHRSSVAESSSDGEFVTPRSFMPSSNSIGDIRLERRNLIPPHHHQHRTRHFLFDRDGDEENLGQGHWMTDVESDMSYQPVVKPSRKDIESIFSFTRHGRIEEVNDLLTRGVPIDVRDDNGNTILSVACQNGCKRLVKMALRRGADINALNFRGNSPLHFCYKYRKIELGQYLISKGANTTIRNHNGHTCEDLLLL